MTFSKMINILLENEQNKFIATTLADKQIELIDTCKYSIKFNYTDETITPYIYDTNTYKWVKLAYTPYKANLETLNELQFKIFLDMFYNENLISAIEILEMCTAI